MRDRECMVLVSVTYIMAVLLKTAHSACNACLPKTRCGPDHTAMLEKGFTRRTAGVCSSLALSLVFLAVF